MSLNGGAREDWGATCEICEWVRSLRTEKEAKIVIVLHALTKHPERYTLTTGTDADIAKIKYKDLIAVYRKDL